MGGQKQILEKPLNPAKEQQKLEEQAKKLCGGGWAIEWWQPRTEIEDIGDAASRSVLEPIFQKGRGLSSKEKRKYLEEYPNILLGIKELRGLLQNPELIPESWKSKVPILFYGTVLCNEVLGGFWILFIYWSGARWQRGMIEFGGDDDTPSAILKMAKENSKKNPKQPCQAA